MFDQKKIKTKKRKTTQLSPLSKISSKCVSTPPPSESSASNSNGVPMDRGSVSMNDE